MIPAATIGEVEVLLDLKSRVALTKADKKALKEESKLDAEQDIELSESERNLIWSKLKTMTGFPVHERTLRQKRKMESTNIKEKAQK